MLLVVVPYLQTHLWVPEQILEQEPEQALEQEQVQVKALELEEAPVVATLGA